MQQSTAGLGAERLVNGPSSLARGLIARERRRVQTVPLVSELPRVAHSAVLLRDPGGIIRIMRDEFRWLVGKPVHSLPPRLWHRLDSLGEAYAAHQRGDRGTVVHRSRRNVSIVEPPGLLCDSLAQVLVVSRRGRIVLEVARNVGDSGWLVRGKWGCYARSACFVFVSSEGKSCHVPCKEMRVERLR
jgi:hypothetical protein